MGTTSSTFHTTTQYLVHQLVHSPLIQSIQQSIHSIEPLQLNSDVHQSSSITEQSMQHSSALSYATFHSIDIRISIIQYCAFNTINSVKQLNHEFYSIVTNNHECYQYCTVRLPTYTPVTIPYHTIQYIQHIELHYDTTSFIKYYDFRVLCDIIKQLNYLQIIHVDCNHCSEKGSNSLKTCCLSYCILRTLIQSNQYININQLHIMRCDRSDIIQMIHKFKQLSTLHMNGGRCITDDALFNLSRAYSNKHMLQLNNLLIDCTNITDYGITQLSTINSVTQLTLLNTKNTINHITHHGIVQLKQLTHLRRLKLTSIHQFDPTQLQFINVCPFISGICELQQLLVLEIEIISSKRISPELLQPFNKLTNLHALYIISQDKRNYCTYQTCHQSKTHLLNSIQLLPKLQLLAMMCCCQQWPAITNSINYHHLKLYSTNNYHFQYELDHVVK